MYQDETKRRRPNDENTPARRTRTPLGGASSRASTSSSTRPTGTRTAPSSRVTTPSTARRTRRTADENVPPLPVASSSKPRRALGLSDAFNHDVPPAAAPPSKAERRAALGAISEAGRPAPERQNTAPTAPSKAPPGKTVPRTPLGSIQRNLFVPPAPHHPEFSAKEKDRLAAVGATTRKTQPPPRTPRDQIGRPKRLPPLPPVATPRTEKKKGEKRKINVLEDPDECTTLPELEERFTPSPETHRTAMTARRLQRQAFAPEPEDRFDEAEEFELEVDLPDLDLEDDGFLI